MAIAVIAGGIIVLLIVISVSLLAIPVDVALRVRVAEESHFNTNVCWLFGLVRKNIAKGKRKPDKEQNNKSKKRLRSISGFLKSRELLKRSLGLLFDLLTRIRVRRLRTSMRIGLQDPANTGVIYGSIWPVMALLNSHRRVAISVTPDFNEPAFELSAAGTVRVYPITFVLPCLRFALSRPVRRTTYRVVFKR